METPEREKAVREKAVREKAVRETLAVAPRVAAVCTCLFAVSLVWRLPPLGNAVSAAIVGGLFCGVIVLGWRLQSRSFGWLGFFVLFLGSKIADHIGNSETAMFLKWFFLFFQWMLLVLACAFGLMACFKSWITKFLRLEDR